MSSMGTPSLRQRLWHVLERSEKEPAQTAMAEIGAGVGGAVRGGERVSQNHSRHQNASAIYIGFL